MHRRQRSGRRHGWLHPIGWTTLSLLLLAGLSASHDSSESLSELQLVGYGGVGAIPHSASGAKQSAPEADGSVSKNPPSIAGSVVGLYPGVALPLVLTVTNPKAVSITVTSIRTVVSEASALCLSANVHVTTFTGALLVPAKGKAATTVEVHMAHKATNACQGAVFPFQYHGLAEAS
jgi:threonine/homoserine/homoserine lactone efflux protein